MAKRCLTLCAILALNLPHSSLAHPQHNSVGRSRPSFLDDDVVDRSGSDWGKGCSYVCEGNFDDIMETWDHFSTYVILN